jgi:hypothetical protein
MEYFFFQLERGFKHLAEKPDEDGDDGWYMSPNARTFYRCAGKACFAVGNALDHLQLWRFQARHAVWRGIRATCLSL